MKFDDELEGKKNLCFGCWIVAGQLKSGYRKARNSQNRNSVQPTDFTSLLLNKYPITTRKQYR